MAYRVEVSPNNRAGCKNKECKDGGIKIFKGQLRFGTFVTIKEHQSWAYKHWGCVTPKQIINLKSSIDDDPDNLDGYDELPEDFQEKIKKALEEGHVADEDWSGDIEMNRAGKNGFRTPETKKARREAAKDEEEGSASPSKAPPKKRGRVKDEPDVENVDYENQPAKKKKKTSVKKEKDVKKEDVQQEEEQEAKPAKRGRKVAVVKAETGTTIKKEDVNDENDRAILSPPTNKGRASRKPAATKKVKNENVDSDVSNQMAETTEAPIPRRTRAPRIAATGKKIKDEETDDNDEPSEAPESKPPATRTRAPRKTSAKQKTKSRAKESTPSGASNAEQPSFFNENDRVPLTQLSDRSVKKQEDDHEAEDGGLIDAVDPDPQSEADDVEVDTAPKPKANGRKLAKKTTKRKNSKLAK